MKNLLRIGLVALLLNACGEWQQWAEQVAGATVTEADMARALKEALMQGVQKEVSRLTEEGGFYRQADVRIGFPPELQNAARTLRQMGLGSLVDQAELKFNRAAEEAVREATPIFMNAIRQMTITDARNILLGDSLAATAYLQAKTHDTLYRKFYPVVQKNMAAVGADKIYRDLVSRYNRIPFVKPVNTDLTDYITREALKGVYKKIGEEEVKIRTDVRERTTDLLRKVFALQDRRNTPNGQSQ